MSKKFADRDFQRQEIERISQSRGNLRLKYAAIGVIGVAIGLQIAGIIWMGYMSDRMLLFLRGFAGLFAIVFVVLVCILVYRVQSEYFKPHDKERGH